MKTLLVSVAVLLLVLPAAPCSMAYVRTLWTKNPRSQSNLFAFERKGRVGFIDSAGKVIIKPTIPGPIDDVGDFSDGIARVEGHGYIGETGNWVIRGAYFASDDFSDGLARVTVEDATQRSGKSDVYLDPVGNIVLKMRSLRAGAFTEGMALCEGEGKPPLRSFQPGNLQYSDYPGLKGYIDKTGKLAIQPAFADAGPAWAVWRRVTLTATVILHYRMASARVHRPPDIRARAAAHRATR